MNKIVVLDGHVLNPGDLSWEPLMALGDVRLYDRTAAEDVISRIADAKVVITNKVLITREVMDACPDIRYIGVLATGYNVVDTHAAKEKGIAVTNIPSYSTPSVAQMTMALLLEICHHIGAHSDSVHQGRWTKCEDFSYWDYPLIELNAKTYGIIGFGSIGRAVAQLARAFGMDVIIYTRTQREADLLPGMRFVSLGELLECSDIISLHCPLTEETTHLICEESISKMKPSAIVLNLARGPVVCEADVASALRNGALGYYATDVLSIEPPRADNPLLGVPRCIITPHIAWAALESRQRLMDTATGNVKAFLQGEWRNRIV